MADTRRTMGWNVDKVRAVQERRRSGGHGLHKDRRTRRARTRSVVLAREMREMYA